MANDWKSYKWGDLATLEYGKSLKGYRDCESGYRVYGTNGPIGWHTSSLFDEPTVIVGRKGAYRGIHYAAKPSFVIDTAFYLKPKCDFDTKWAYYELLTKDINGMDSGSAIPSTSREDFYSLPVSLPPIPEQKAIARILGTLDDKIELNRQMNDTLEAMARALFKSWFVDFDPAIENALAAGNPIPELLHLRAETRGALSNQKPSLPAYIKRLFPDAFHLDEEMGWIPEGWKIRRVDELANVKSGKRLPKGHKLLEQQTAFPYLRGVDVTSGRFSRSDVKYLSAETQAAIAKYIVNTEDVVVTIVGTIGRVIYIDKEWDGANLTENAARITDIRCICSSYVFQYLSSPAGQENIKSRIAGSVQGKLPLYQIKAIKLLVPDRKIIDVFEKSTSSLDSALVRNLNEFSTLTKLRDTLLPKLLSGELRIPDAEQLVAGSL